MRSKAEIKVAYDLCKNTLGGKPLVEYTPYDRAVRFQRSALRNCYEAYEDYVQHQAIVLKWLPELDGAGSDNQIVANVWRWCLGLKDELPVNVQKQR